MKDSIWGADSDRVLSADALCMSFRTEHSVLDALKDITVSAYKKKITGFVGADGAGKTTLMRLAAGLLLPTKGTLSILGYNSENNLDTIRSRISYMPQQFGLYEDLSILENLNFFAGLHNVPKETRKDRYELLMELTGLAPFIKRKAGQLSGGMKQKLGIACCLVKSPELLILDEPTVGVDPVSRRDLWNILNWLIKEEGTGIVLSTSYLDEAEQCNHVIMLHRGRVLQEGPPNSFKKKVSGRVYLAEPAPGIEPRAAQQILSKHENVVDTTIRSGLIRTVLKTAGDHSEYIFKNKAVTQVEKAEPLFEDAFIDILYEQQDHHISFETGDINTPAKNPLSEKTVVVRVEDLVKHFGDFTAVKHISFEVSKGEIFGLLGANGAGKTTTFRMLCGLLPASEGIIHVAGNDLRHSPAESRRKLGYMAQKFSLYQQLTVLHNLRFFGSAYGLKGNKLQERVQWALNEFELDDRKHLSAGQLPGGFRQRLAMAAAMLHEPDILFLDEPTSGADPLARREFWHRINGFSRLGVTVIVTTHFMEEAEYCDNMIIMSQGAELAKGTPSEIRAMATSVTDRLPSIEDAFIELTEGGLQKPLLGHLQ